MTRGLVKAVSLNERTLAERENVCFDRLRNDCLSVTLVTRFRLSGFGKLLRCAGETQHGCI